MQTAVPILQHLPTAIPIHACSTFQSLLEI